MTTLEQRALERMSYMLGSGSKNVHSEFENDPLDFISDVLDTKIWQEQEHLILSVKDSRFTAVEAGHGVGKSFASALLVCWWLSTREEAKVITLAPTWAQVANVLWREIRSKARKNRLPGNVFDTPRWDVSPERFGIGLSPKKATQEDVASLQGYHSPNLLVILDEAPGISRLLWDAIRSLAVGDNNRVLAIGNPIEQSGPFWEACTNQNWNHIRISCLQHPNVIEQKEIIPGAVSYTWVKEMIRDHCVIVGDESAFDKFNQDKLGNFEKADVEKRRLEHDRQNEGSLNQVDFGNEIEEGGQMEMGDLGKPIPLAMPDPSTFLFEGVWYRPNAVFKSRVLGLAPEEASSQLIPLSWVNSAQQWEMEAIPPVVIGFDPSRYGGDPSTMVARAGPKVLWVKRRYPRSKNPGLELAGWLKEEISNLQSVSVAYIDEIGVGSTVVDQSRVLGLPVRGINSGWKAYASNRFFNLRTENWWKVRTALQKAELDLPTDNLLEGDLTAPHYGYDDKGRYQLERKEQVKDRLGRSPDSGDALALTFASPVEGTLPEGVNPVRELATEKSSRWFVGSKPSGSRWKRR